MLIPLEFGEIGFVWLFVVGTAPGVESRPANPYDNASCESFIKTLKREEIYEKSRRGTLRACATTGIDVATNGDTARKNARATVDFIGRFHMAEFGCG